MEPTNADLARQLEQGFMFEPRVRGLEIKVAKLESLPEELKAVEGRLLAAIEATRPVRTSGWQIAAVLIASAAFLFGVAGVVYGSR